MVVAIVVTLFDFCVAVGLVALVAILSFGSEFFPVFAFSVKSGFLVW